MKMHALPAQLIRKLAGTPSPHSAAVAPHVLPVCPLVERQLQKIMDGLSPDILVGTVSLNGVLTYVNRSSLQALGYAHARVLGQPMVDAAWWPSSPNAREQIHAAFHRALRGETSRFDIDAIAQKGRTLTLDVMFMPLLADDRTVSAVLLSGRNITERVLAQARSTYLATHDCLTGLPNRQSFVCSIKDRLASDGLKAGTFSLLAVGLDRLNWVNEALGPTAGDLVLRSFAQRLREAFGAEATVARLGGDVFAVLIQAPLDAAQAMARAAQRRLDTPITIHGRTLYVSFCVGVTEVHLPNAQPDEAQALLQQAETALCYAKLQGPGSVSPFVAPAPSADFSRLFLLSDLHDAVPREELVVYYQPQWNAKTNQVTGAEALVRWQHPEHGLVPPDQFIPIAEDSGLIVPIGAWVLRQACAAGVRWQKAGFCGLHVSVNVSPRQLQGCDFPATVMAILAETGLPPERLVLEVTESALMENVEHVRALLTSLRDAGITIALDDFGAGYSSLGQLRKLPIDVLKIDRALVPDVAAEAESASITRAIITMAASLRLQVLAEGVETRSQVEMLTSSGCHLMQGYFLSRPLPESELVKLLRRHLVRETPREAVAPRYAPPPTSALAMLQLTF